MIPLPVLSACVAAVIAFATAWAVQGWRYDKELARRDTAQAVAAQKAENAARVREAQLQERVDRLSAAAAKREAQLASRAAATARASGGLRSDIARLDARSVAKDAGGTCAADEARLARQLLGACADEYRVVAQEADGLREQVIGLQDYARAITNGGTP